ncbi:MULTISPECIES: DUF4129 domain-containing protein [unclassified Streptomyces]|uniref:DUF4129 domain-containing protein n=1 Tax=unclassified Streptomyces TaxID=2593676 RepID=UPI000374FB97|nr:DUF4129 domain-containing protein [Streptomyces sp. HmicA12]
MRAGRDGRRTPPGPALAAGAVALLAVAALVLRPGEGLLHSGRGPLGGSGFLVVGLALCWAYGLVRLSLRLRSRIDGDLRAVPPREERLRQAGVPLLIAGPLALGVLALVLHRFPTGRKEPAGPPPTAPMTPSHIRGPAPDARSGHGSSLPLQLVAGVIAACLLVVAVVLLVRLLRRRGLTLPRVPARPATTEEDAERELLLAAVREGRRALADGTDARAAVIACYAAMENALAASGVPRRAADSPADLLLRASRAGLAAGSAAPRLTALFREARYSTHPMDDSRRVAAADALEEIAELLRERREQEASP